MPPLSFLVVDDDPIALEVARERLEQLGFVVSTRTESLGTSRWLVENQPDFLLLDVMMPALSGGELANLIRRRQLRTKVILHSSKSREELALLVRDTGALGAITKGLDNRRFAAAVVRLTRPLGAELERAENAEGWEP